MLRDGIYNTDCIEGMRLIDDRSVDLIFCDLPYGVTAKNKWDVCIDTSLLWGQYERIIKPNGAIVLFGRGKFTARMIISKEKLYRYSIIWEKTTPTGFLNANKMPLMSHEEMMVFYKRLPTYNPQKTGGHTRKVSTARHKLRSNKSSNYRDYGLNSYDSTERFPTSAWTVSTDKQKEALHPTQKPLELCRRVIRTYTNAGDLVLDNCCGSGTIPKAAVLEGRRYIGMDNGRCERTGRLWADIAKERIAGAEANHE